MNGFNFSWSVRQALAHAREEAQRLGHEYVGPEHILLGLLRTDNAAVQVLNECGVAPEDMRRQIEGTIQRGTATNVVDVPYTSRAKKSLELAMTEARELNSDTVNCGMALLGLLREEKNISAQLLTSSGVTLDRARTTYVSMTKDLSVEIER
jgi:ATP-dependent Clp protease ATP-binding subunit ClpC